MLSTHRMLPIHRVLSIQRMLRIDRGDTLHHPTRLLFTSLGDSLFESLPAEFARQILEELGLFNLECLDSGLGSRLIQ